MTEPVREILVVELLGGFGDLLLALPSIHGLARRHPGAAVRVLTFAPGDELVRTDPCVAEVMPLDDHRDGAARAAVLRELARRRYDVIVTTTTYDGIADVCSAAAPIAVTNLWRSPPADERVDRRFLRLLADEGLVAREDVDLPLRVHLAGAELARGDEVVAAALPADPSPSSGLDLAVPKRAPVPAEPRRPAGPPIVLVPGAGMPIKRWPTARWRQLADGLRRDGLPVLTIGEPADGASGGQGAALPGTPLPPGGLRELAAVFAAVAARGGVVVGGDTGPTRLATAAGARAVGLFGPTVAGRYGLDPRLGANLQGLPGCAVRTPTAITEQECWWSGRCPLTGDAAACMADLSVAAAHTAVRAKARTRAEVRNSAELANSAELTGGVALCTGAELTGGAEIA